MRVAAPSSFTLFIAALALALPLPSAAQAQSGSDWGITVDNAAWSGGTAWTGPEGARVTFTRPAWAGQAQDQLLRDGRLAWSSAWFSPGGDWTRSWSRLAEGSYTARADIRTQVTCSQGGRICGYGTTRNSAAFSVDTTPPSIPGLAVPAGAVASSDLITWSPSWDARSGVARYQVLVDGVVRAEVAAAACAGECATGVDPAGMPDGERQVTVRAIDLVGNASESAGTRQVRDIPQVALLDPPAFVLKGRPVLLRARGSVANGGELSYEWDLDGDGRFDLATGDDPTARLTPVDDATVAVRATAPGGGEATARHRLDVRVRPPSDDPGVTIEQGARFTKSRRVALEISWPEGATTMRIATDGGFRGVRAQPVQAQADIVLDATDDARLPHVVYVRFQGPGLDARETYTDDIILDTTAPVVDAAVAARVAGGARITSRARDAVSGVESLQVAARAGARVVTVPYAARVTAPVAARRPVVRAVDRAGNASPWMRATRRR